MAACGGEKEFRPSKKRWSDSLDNFFIEKDGSPRGSWKAFAQKRDLWKKMEDEFVVRSWYR